MARFGSASPGTAATTPANIPGAPTFSTHDGTSITIAPAYGSNASVVEFAIYCNELSKYVGADGAADEASETWRTAALWGATVAITGFTMYSGYTFKVKARNELDEATAFGASSVSMGMLPDIDYGFTSDALARTITGGDTICAAGTAVNTTLATSDSESGNVEYYGNIPISYTLVNDSSTASRITVQFSEDSGVNWAAATKGTGGDAITALTSSPAGVAHTYMWDSYTDAGESENKSTTRIRITPYDASPSGGDAGTVGETADFRVNNRPAQITWVNSDSRTFSKDTTPTFQGIMPSLRSGDRGYPMLRIYNSANVLQQTATSVDDVTGWEYETAPATWVAMAFTGILAANIDGVNRVRYTVQTALATGAYTVTGEMGEVRDRS